MPGWGTGSFENEHAQHWLEQLSQLTPEGLSEMLQRAAEADYLGAAEGSAAIAAAEVVAAAAGAPTDPLPGKISDWIGRFDGSPSARFIEVASQAVEKVRRSSELRDLWHQAEGLNEWSTSLRDLEVRLSPK